jgi:hypothetical protein
MRRVILFGMAILLACAQQSATEPNNEQSSEVPAVFKKFSSAVNVSVDGVYIVLRATSVPDHKSPYFGRAMHAMKRTMAPTHASCRIRIASSRNR